MLMVGGLQRLTLHYDPHWPRSTSSQSPPPCSNSTNSWLKRKVHDWTGDILSQLKAGNSLSSWERPRCWFSTPVDMEVNRTSEFSDLDGWVNIFGNNVHVKTQLHRSNTYLHSWILLFSIFVTILCPIMMILSLNVPQTKAFSWGFKGPWKPVQCSALLTSHKTGTCRSGPGRPAAPVAGLYHAAAAC